jgi:hypothetical protein
MVKNYSRESGRFTVYSMGKTAQPIFRREHNIVNFRNAKWKIHNLSFLFIRKQTRACIHSAWANLPYS